MSAEGSYKVQISHNGAINIPKYIWREIPSGVTDLRLEKEKDADYTGFILVPSVPIKLRSMKLCMCKSARCLGAGNALRRAGIDYKTFTLHYQMEVVKGENTFFIRFKEIL